MWSNLKEQAITHLVRYTAVEIIEQFIDVMGKVHGVGIVCSDSDLPSCAKNNAATMFHMTGHRAIDLHPQLRIYRLRPESQEGANLANKVIKTYNSRI